MPKMRYERTAKPFVKWAGGKSQILNEIRAKYPAELGGRIKKYAEPFVGGGAVLFDVLNCHSLDEVYISDINRELIHTYISIRDNIDWLVEILKTYEQEYLPARTETRKDIYYDKRNKFNELKLKDDNSLELAALFIFLNRTCICGIETNFYTSDGSKLNETARSYKNIAIESKDISGFAFVWFTDGNVWKSVRNNLEETFDVLEHIYCIADLDDGIMSRIFV